MTETHPRLFVFDIDGVIGSITKDRSILNYTFENFSFYEDACGETIHFTVRPHILEFITTLVSLGHHVAVWSASDMSYVKHVVEGLNGLIDKPIEWKFIWDICKCEQNNYIKNLMRIREQYPEYNVPELITFFDDLPKHFGYNKENNFNCVLVPHFKLDVHDNFFSLQKMNKYAHDIKHVRNNIPKMQNRLYVFDIDDVIGVIQQDVCDTDYSLEQFSFTDTFGRYAQFIVRPHILEFITTLVANKLHVAIWSAGDSEYVKQIVIGLNTLVVKPIDWKFTWDVCQCEPISYIKNLQKIQERYPEYNKSELITFFDDLPKNIEYNKKNGFNCVLVPCFKADKPDIFFK